MGMFNFLLQKEEAPKKAEPPKKQAEKTLEPGKMLKLPTLNKRGHMRYYVKDIPAGTIGVIVDISRCGCRIKKGVTDQGDTPDVRFCVEKKEVAAHIAWQDANFMGLEFTESFESLGFITKHLKKVKERVFEPKVRFSVETIKGFISKDPFSLMVHLMTELESPNININRLKSLILKLPGLGQEVAMKAGIKKGADDLDVSDIDQAVKRLGLDAVKKATLEFIKTKGKSLEGAQAKDELHEAMKVLKKVFFNVLAPYFGYTEDMGFADNLAAAEFKGIELILSKTKDKTPEIKDLYNASTKVYSEMTRFCEWLRFGRDSLNITRLFIINIRRALVGLYDGYLLAHTALNPVYTLDPSVKLSLNKNNLNFSYVTYLTFIATQAIIEKDPAAAAHLMARLHGTGMDTAKLYSFMQKYVHEINTVMADLGRSTSFKAIAPANAFKIADYMSLAVTPQYGRFIKYFREFDANKRIAIAYEDEAYTHFMIGKILSAEDVGLNKKMFCVVPCENLSTEPEDEIQAEMFSFFGIVVLKNIDKLDKRLLRVFVKLWNTFEGGIIVTFSRYSMLDFNSRDLFVFFAKHIIDYPS